MWSIFMVSVTSAGFWPEKEKSVWFSSQFDLCQIILQYLDMVFVGYIRMISFTEHRDEYDIFLVESWNWVLYVRWRVKFSSYHLDHRIGCGKMKGTSWRDYQTFFYNWDHSKIRVQIIMLELGARSNLIHGDCLTSWTFLWVDKMRLSLSFPSSLWPIIFCGQCYFRCPTAQKTSDNL